MSKPMQAEVAGELSVSKDETGGKRELRREDIFDVLSNRRRRYVLHYLKQQNAHESASLPELASHVAAWENDTDVSQVTYDDRKSVQTSLYQLHLPKLAEMDLIEYDKRAGEIKRTKYIDDIEFYLETVPDREISWPVVFLGVSTATVALSIASAMDALVIGAVPTTLWFLVASGAFLVTSVLFTYHHRYKMRLGTGGPPPECL